MLVDVIKIRCSLYFILKANEAANGAEFKIGKILSQYYAQIKLNWLWKLNPSWFTSVIAKYAARVASGTLLAILLPTDVYLSMGGK